MRVESVKRDVTSSGTMQVAKATIKATPKIFDMFANDTYANKPLAIMRELVANGVDAHVAAGRPDRPVEVVLPTPLDPTCRVRDYGIGMSHDFVMGPFMAYTDGSTKDSDDKAIGGFGIGSKSPFAYVDQFTLRVVHDGVLSIYTMFKDEDGIPAIGLQAQTTTDEPNGVEISFPVEDADMAEFAKAAQDALQFFHPLPLMTNGTLNPPDYSFVGNGWAMCPKAGPLGVVMGGVRYPVDPQALAWELRGDARLSPLLTYGLDLTLPIGACGVAMSREQLSYVPKTSEGIRAGLEAILDDVVLTFATFFDNCASEWDAMKLLLGEVGATSYSRSGRAQLMLSNARYQGRSLQTGFRLADNDLPGTKAWMIGNSGYRRNSNCPNPKWTGLTDLFEITPGNIEAVIIDDLPLTPKSKTITRIKNWVDTNHAGLQKNILVLRGDNMQILALLQLLRFPTDYTLTSDMPVPVAAPRTATTRPRVRMFTFNGGDDQYTQRKITNLSPSMSKRNAVKEIAHADQPTSGTMVVMNNFELPVGFHDKIATGLFKVSDLYFVNSVDAPKIVTTFVNFDDMFEAKLKVELAKYPRLAEGLAMVSEVNFRNVFTSWRHIRDNVKLTPAQKGRPFGKIAALYEEYAAPFTDAQRKLAPFVTAKLPAGIKPEAMVKAYETKQADAVILFEELRLGRPGHLALLLKHL